MMGKFFDGLKMGTLLMFNALPVFADHAEFEAEDAQYSDCTVVTDMKYSGGKALRMTEKTAEVTFVVDVEEKGKYVVYVGGDGIGGDKEANCSVNGNKSSFKVNVYGEVEVGTFMMNKGGNTIAITPKWTWFNIDYIRIEACTDTLVFDISDSPVDDDAIDAAKSLYNFLFQNFGVKTISGMMTGDMSSDKGDITLHDDIRAVYEVAGKYPALVGFDFMNATGLMATESWRKDYTRSCIELAKDTYRRGGIPAFTWHWRDPSRCTDAFYTRDTQMRISSAMNSDGSWNTSSPLYNDIIKDIDVVADYLLELQREGVACLFRPLHEASGGWFWWGREGAEPFRKLYRLVFDEMVKVKGVHNVIWVWNADDADKDWDPGTELYDVVSADIYNEDYDYSSNYVTFEKLKRQTGGKKILALSENGPIPDMDKEVEDEAMWSWWMPWYNTWNGHFVHKTSREEWRKCMSDSRVITLEDSEVSSMAVAVGVQNVDVDRELSYCVRQVNQTLEELSPIDYTLTPRNIGADERCWNLRSVKTPEEWCAGFFPGILWMASSAGHESDGERLKEEAAKYSAELEYLAYAPVYDHDLGFIMIGSYLKGWEATHDEHYKAVLEAAADTLATLYNEKVGTLLSWPRNMEMFGGHNTIIDNMINLELLFFSDKAENKEIAVHHADTTMAYHFRPDGTVNHVAVYDPTTGKHLYNCTHQGFGDNTLWSRGQAWAIYGYTMVYRYTKERRFLDFAMKVADVFLDRLPDDGIPWWDMGDPMIPHSYRDASAAAVTASGLVELSSYVEGAAAERYLGEAKRMLARLSSADYQSREQKPSFLLHSVGNMPAGSEIDASINYADYYYIEALLRLRDYEDKGKTAGKK